MRRTLFLFLCGILLTGLGIPMFERIHICTDEHRPALFGFPMVQRTAVPWVNSMSGVRYVGGTLVNALCIFAVLWCIVRFMARWSWWCERRLPKWLPWLLLAPGILLVSLDLLAIEWRWQWATEWDMTCFKGHWRIGSVFQ